MIQKFKNLETSTDSGLAWLAQFFLPAKFGRRHFNVISKFLFEFIIRGNKLLIFEVAILNLLVRFLRIANFAIALKAVLAAIRPDLVLKLINAAGSWVGYDKTFEYNDLSVIFISLVLTVGIINWLVNIRSIQRNQVLHDRIVNNPDIQWEGRTLDQDLFIIDKLPNFSLNIVKCIDITIFLAVMVCLVFIFSPQLAVFLIPLTITLIVMHIMSGRNKLRMATYIQNARRDYTTEKNEKGKSSKRRDAANNTERARYFQSRYKVALNNGTKRQFDNFVASAVLGGIIFYLFEIELEVGALASLLIIFVVAIRQTLSASSELGNQLLAILALRQDIKLLETILKLKNKTN